jgi:hypothetical protein
LAGMRGHSSQSITPPGLLPAGRGDEELIGSLLASVVGRWVHLSFFLASSAVGHVGMLSINGKCRFHGLQNGPGPRRVGRCVRGLACCFS